MAAVTVPLCCSLLSFVFVFASAEQKNITAESGQSITLPCRAPNNNNTIRVVKWSRDDLGDKYVLLYRDGQFVPDDQDPSFKNRVDLQDRQMKGGDVSLILRNVMINETGTYECQVFTEKTRSLQLIEKIYLNVVPPGPPGGAVGLAVGLSVSAVLLVAAAVGFFIYRKYKSQQN